jgi:hypothetical protein
MLPNGVNSLSGKYVAKSEWQTQRVGLLYKETPCLKLKKIFP